MSNEKIKTIFISTSDFGLPALRALHADGDIDIKLVITQPDKKVGRKQLLTPPPVKEESVKLGLPVSQPVNIYDAMSEIKKIAPDIIIVAAYAQILPEKILALPRYGCLNIHASLLPKCRGAACIQGAILSGDTETGVTIMKMDKNLDTGPILTQKFLTISPADTAGVLFEKLSAMGAELIIPTLKNYIAGHIQPRWQNEQEKSYYKVLNKADGHIDWRQPAVKIERFIRAMTPWPGAYGYLESGNIIMLKIIAVDPTPQNINRHKPGTLFIGDSHLLIQCEQDALQIKKLQLAGKKIITAADFIRGYQGYIGKILK